MAAAMRMTSLCCRCNLQIVRKFSSGQVYQKAANKIEAEKFIRLKQHPLKWTESLQEYLQEQKQQEADGNNKEPHMLHMVYRVKTLVHRPWWEKDIAKKLGLDEKPYNPVILKNTPSVNKKLKEIKHLIVIKPVTFPHGLPEHESDLDHVQLKFNGEFIVKKRIDVSEKEPEAESQNKWKMQVDTLKKRGFRKIQTYDVSAEYFKPKYTYRFNQDGKEYRYTHNSGEKNKRYRGHLQFPDQD